MSDKKLARLRRARQTRIRIRENRAVRLTVHRTNGHIYAQITTPGGERVLAAASSLEKEVRGQLKHGSTRKAAELVGQRIVTKAKEKGIEQVAFDRAGYRYHGRIKALAEAARRGGLYF
jgi:large subunit ribosomal protein L18